MPTVSLRRLLVATLCATALAAATRAQNHAPNAPQITEPSAPLVRLSPFDVHMETRPFSDVDPGDVHAASDWELWTVSPAQRVWAAIGVTGVDMVHIHLGDGIFEGSHAGRSFLLPSTRYQMRVRHEDSSGDPLTQWSLWSAILFDTVALETATPLEIDDVDDAIAPIWTDPNGNDVDLSVQSGVSLRLETGSAQPFLRIDASPNPGNAVTNYPPLAQHDPVRVVVTAGPSSGLFQLPESDLTIVEHSCEAITIRLPAMAMLSNQSVVYWVSLEGQTYIGLLSQTTPLFTAPARTLIAPYVVREPGYSVDVVATGLNLPVNIAFVPNAGTQPVDPKCYVTELYGTIKTITNDGSVLTYASGLLNYTPNGQFPGAGEQGLTGLAVDPVSGDVFASMLNYNSATGLNDPRVVRLTSIDGGRTSSSRQVILAMTNESQGQSHQVSRLEIVNGELYCHMGDGFTTATAQQLTSYRGKILRMNLDGSPVISNPFYNGGTRDARDYIFAYGVRNPFGGAWREADGFRYVVENGPSVDRFAKIVAGRNYLWSGTDQSMANYALYNWNPAHGPVNLAFVQPATFGGSGFPQDKMDHAFVSESGPTYARGRQALGKFITEFVLDANGNRVSGPTPFVQYVGEGYATVVGLAAGPDGLYFTELYKDGGTGTPTASGGRLLRVRYGDPQDCNGNGQADWCEIASGSVTDCNHNGVPDSCDIALGASTDFDGDGLPDECNLLRETTNELSIAAGGRDDFTLHAGAVHAGSSFALVGSMSGTTPGTPLDGILIPLNIAGDPWFFLTVVAANSPTLPGTIGVLDANGAASASLVLPPHVPPSLSGATLHHAYVVLDPASGRFVLASNAVPLVLRP